MDRTRGQQHAPLFARLPRGPNGLEREEVARNQRARIYGAMIESVARRGYQRTTVAHVIALAGVSRRAFYEQFANKQACFLATYDIVVARARKQVIEGWQGERGWSNRLHAACDALLRHTAFAPKGPRLVLVDALGIGPAARERMQLAHLAFERLVTFVLDAAPDRAPAAPLAARAIVAGTRHVAFMRLLEGRERELATMTEDLLDLIDAYRTPHARRLTALAPAAPSPARPGPVEFLASDDSRARALASLVHLTLHEGYAELSDPQIAEYAGISTEAFHREFASKEAAFLAVLDEIVGEARRAVERSIDDSASWPEAVWRAMAAFVGYLIAHEPLLRMAFVEVFEVGPAMIGRLTRSIDAVTSPLAEHAPAPRHGGPITADAITGATWGIIASHVGYGGLARLPGLVDHLSFVVLAPYVGGKAAVREIEAVRGHRAAG